jgi:hypothetical protein
MLLGHHSLNRIQTAFLDKNFQEKLNLKTNQNNPKRIWDDQYTNTQPFAIVIEES